MAGQKMAFDAHNSVPHVASSSYLHILFSRGTNTHFFRVWLNFFHVLRCILDCTNSQKTQETPCRKPKLFASGNFLFCGVVLAFQTALSLRKE